MSEKQMIVIDPESYGSEDFPKLQEVVLGKLAKMNGHQMRAVVSVVPLDRSDTHESPRLGGGFWLKVAGQEADPKGKYTKAEWVIAMRYDDPCEDYQYATYLIEVWLQSESSQIWLEILDLAGAIFRALAGDREKFPGARLMARFEGRDCLKNKDCVKALDRTGFKAYYMQENI